MLLSYRRHVNPISYRDTCPVYPTPMMESFTILCIGDSHTAGFPHYDPLMGGNPESSYQFWMKKELSRINPESNYSLINEGICGDTSQGIVMRLLPALKAGAYHLVILAGGTNDLGMIDAEQVFANLRQGFDACRNHSIPLIASSIPPISLAAYVPGVIALNSKIKAYAERCQGLSFADWFGALQDERGFLDDRYDSGDGVHLSVAGYKCIGLLLAPLVLQRVNRLVTNQICSRK